MKNKLSLRNNPSCIANLKSRALTALITKGCNILLLASFFSIGLSTLYSWLNDFNQKGYIDTNYKKRGRKVGTGRILTQLEESILKEIIIMTIPSEHKLNFSTWSRQALES
jgi:transposase